MLPDGYKRNYKGVLDGLMKAVDEGSSCVELLPTEQRSLPFVLQ